MVLILLSLHLSPNKQAAEVKVNPINRAGLLPFHCSFISAQQSGPA